MSGVLKAMPDPHGQPPFTAPDGVVVWAPGSEADFAQKLDGAAPAVLYNTAPERPMQASPWAASRQTRPHLQYAATWFAIAGVFVWFIVLYIRSLREEREGQLKPTA